MLGMRRLLVSLAFSIIAVAQSSSPLRLPTDIRPSRYQAKLDITPGSDSFAGTIQIALEVIKPTAEITLHAKEIEFKSVTPAPREIRKGEND